MRSLGSLAVAFLMACTGLSQAGSQDGGLRIEVITAKNLVVDSNVESPSTNGPSAAHLGVKIHNDGPVPLTNVYIKIGDLTNPLTSDGTPATFPARTVTVGGSGGYSGSFALQMPGGLPDAVRYIPVIQPGRYVAQYFFVTYPLKDGAGNAVTGSAPDPGDDLWLQHDIWAYASEGAITRRVEETTKVTMRNEISAMANKIWPNSDGKVPDEYLDAIESSLGWRPDSNAPRAGTGVRLEGIWYDLGNVGAGFDNDGDGLPDRNAWMQPAGDPDPALYDPRSVRLLKCYGIVVVKLNDGTSQLIPFEDQLYFENIPANNNGAVGLVYYEFMPLRPNVTTTLSPYQEVASGYDNEKFNGDYGAPGGTFTSIEPELSFDKSGNAVVGTGTNASYTLTATNHSGEGIGFPSLSLPLLFEDSIPGGLVYVAGSATTSNTPPPGRSFAVTWSTDGGTTWVATEPAPGDVTTVRWALDGALDPSATATVRFEAAVPVTYVGATVDNTGSIKLGTTGALAYDTHTSLVSGINSLGDLVWKDDDRDSFKDAGESGIADVTVRLHYDADGDGVLDAADPLYGTTVTDGSGTYAFANLPDARFIAIVDAADIDLPAGFSLPDSVTAGRAVDLDSGHANAAVVANLTVDWPFISALVLTKNVSPATYGAGELVSYTIDLENHSVAVPPLESPIQTAWATTVSGNRTLQNAASSQGAPDDTYATGNWSAGTDFLSANGFTFGSPTGVITKVELVFEAYLSGSLSNDEVDVLINGSAFSTLTGTTLNSHVGAGNESVIAVDITSLNATWSWTQAQSLVGRLNFDRINSNDGQTLNVDSIGFRVTTVAGPPPSGSYGPTTIDPLPLTDVFDPAKLSFVSATPPPTSVSGGTVTWSNVGPLNPGARETVTVVFRALTPPDIDADNEPDPTTHTNVATASNARFVNGRPTNSATDDAVVTINPRGEIGDTVFWDINANGVQNVGEPGLANVRVTLSNGTETTTDSDGYYLFRSLADGTYTVTIDTASLPWTTFTQTRDPDSTVNNASTVTIDNNDGLGTNNSYLDRDFGYDSTLNIISGKIFEDNNGDGDQDPGEGNLPSVTVTLLRDADSNGSYETTAGTTTTNASGYYVFGSLANGLYRVVVTPPASTTQTLDPDLAPGTSGDNATNENASGGNLYANNDFAYRPAGALALGDTLYIDGDHDGVQDAGETGIRNITVFLYEDADGDGIADPEDAFIAAQVTDAAGFYQFTSLPPRDYRVIVDTLDPQFPAGLIQTDDYDSTFDSRGAVDLVASINTADFGYAPSGSGSLGDTVFIDGDGDGVKDPAESGIPNIAVSLWWDVDGNGSHETFISSASTSVSGLYLFNGLPDGDFEARLDTADPDLPAGLVNTTPVTQQLTLAGGIGTELNGSATPSDSSLKVDFGFIALATIGDYVFFDANNNATQDYSETGIPNVTVQLWSDPNHDGDTSDGALIDTITTADGTGAYPAGFYRFADVLPGWYVVKVVPASLPQSGGNPIPQSGDPDRDGVPADDNTYPLLPPADHADSEIYVAYGSNYGGADFGYRPAGVVGDFVWFDLDQDGVQDSGEPGIANVAVEVTDGLTVYNVSTDANGEWSVANLADGTWTVTVLASNFSTGGPLENLAASFDADGTPDSSVSVVVAGGIVGPTGNPWCLVPDASLDIDFGYQLTGSFSISGTVVIHDTGIVGTADDPDTFAEDGADFDLGPADETELGGVPVYLFASDGTGGWDFIGSTATDPDGAYRFTGLPGDGYRVIIPTTAAPLDRATLTTTAGNAAVAVTGVANTGTSVIQFLTLGGADVNDVDFAFVSDVEYDFGDLPSDFGVTTLSQDGARHVIPAGGSTLFFGTAPDADLDGAPSSFADGDDGLGSDDENGVSPLGITTWANGTVGTGNGGDLAINLTVSSGGGWLVGYIDFNQDGDFLDAGELILSKPVAASGSSDHAFDIPSGAISGTGQSFHARFRILPGEPLLPVFAFEGEAADGEVEDYLFTKPVGASIGNFVWVDADGDGVFDPAEDGLGGIAVNLGGSASATMATSDGTQDVDGDGITDPRGFYRFTNLAAGSYMVSFTAPAGFTPSYDEDGGTLSPNTSTPVALAAGVQHLTADFGLEPLTANISGQVRNDIDGDGELADPDFGIPDVIVRLWTDPNGDGDPGDGVQVGEETTSSTGHYTFSNVPTGSYVIVEIDPGGATSTADITLPNDNEIPLAVVGGTDSTGNDFLDDAPGLLGSIAGSVLDDSDNNGTGDAPLAGVLLSLLDGSGQPVLDGLNAPITATTGVDGSYLFADLIPGTYQVAETQPGGYDSFGDADGGDLDIVGDLTPVVVLPGETNPNNNFIETLDTCANTWAEWQTLHPGENAGGDPDADVLDNLAEFAFVQPYDSGAGDPFCIGPSEDLPGTLEGVFVRPKQATDNVTYVLEYAATLGSPTAWLEIHLEPGDLIITDNGDCTETVIIVDLEDLTGLVAGEGFVRVRADLDEDNDETIDHSSATAVEGWTRTPVEICCRTYNNPYLRCVAFTGTIDSASGSSLLLTSSAGPVDLASLLASGVSYYAEITSGENEGHRFDVLSASGDELTLANDGDLASGTAPFNTITGSLPANLAGDGIVIRRHWTLDELFPPENFGATGSLSTADQVQVSAGGVWTIYWLYDDAGSPRWVKDGTLADQGAAVIPPGQGMFFNSRNTTGSLLAWGQVRENDFIRPLAAGSNLVGGGYPVDQSALGAAGRAMTLAQGFSGSRDFKAADRFYVWKGDAVALNHGYDSYFLLNGAPVQPSMIQWTKVGDATILSRNNSVLFPGDHSVFIDVANDVFTYEIPSPWTP